MSAWQRRGRAILLSGLLLFVGGPALAAGLDDRAPAAAAPGAGTGLAIYARFRAGLADASCSANISPRWRGHFAHAPRELAAGDRETLALFGYVVDAVRAASLPTEYALIPFVESGYRPGAVSSQGPAGLWQMIGRTARSHGVPIQPGYDGRLSPVESTRAAVRYLKTLHGMFAGDWRLAAMAYNAGEYRILGALKRSGQVARDVDLATLGGVPETSRAYVRKLRALACVLEEADTGAAWLQAMDRPVPRLRAVELPGSVTALGAWAREHQHDAGRLARLNPVFVGGRVVHPRGAPARVLAIAHDGTELTPGTVPTTLAMAPPAVDDAEKTYASTAAVVATAGDTVSAPIASRRHTVGAGENAWSIARRYGVSLKALLATNGLDARSVLRTGTVLLIDPDGAPAPAGGR